MTLIHKILATYRNINTKRLLRRKAERINNFVERINSDPHIIDNSKRTLPSPLHNALLIYDPLDRFGDAIFVSGLLHHLNTSLPKLKIYIATSEKYKEIYKNNNCTIVSPNKIENLSAQVDLAVDLGYIDHPGGEKFAILGKAALYLLSCSRMCSHLKCFTGMIDTSSSKHFGERMLQLARTIEGIYGQPDTSLPKTIIRPYPPNSLKTNSQIIYLNADGGVAQRCLSANQVDAILSYLKKKQNTVVAYSSRPEIRDVFSKYNIKINNSSSFMESCKIIAECSLIITPDTSIVHVASAFNIPVVAMYRNNDREYYNYTMLETWGPLSEIREIIISPETLIRSTPISRISNHTIINSIESILTKLSTLDR